MFLILLISSSTCCSSSGCSSSFSSSSCSSLSCWSSSAIFRFLRFSTVLWFVSSTVSFVAFAAFALFPSGFSGTSWGGSWNLGSSHFRCFLSGFSGGVSTTAGGVPLSSFFPFPLPFAAKARASALPLPHDHASQSIVQRIYAIDHSKNLGFRQTLKQISPRYPFRLCQSWVTQSSAMSISLSYIYPIESIYEERQRNFSAGKSLWPESIWSTSPPLSQNG